MYGYMYMHDVHHTMAEVQNVLPKKNAGQWRLGVRLQGHPLDVHGKCRGRHSSCFLCRSSPASSGQYLPCASHTQEQSKGVKCWGAVEPRAKARS